MSDYTCTTLNNIFKRSPVIDLFEHVWVPELKKEALCIGYFWYSDEQKLIYAIAENKSIVNKSMAKHYLEAHDFRLTGFYHQYYLNYNQPPYILFQLVRVEATGNIHMICGLEWSKLTGWVYHLDNIHTPYCTDELIPFLVSN